VVPCLTMHDRTTRATAPGKRCLPVYLFDRVPRNTEAAEQASEHRHAVQHR